MSTIITDCPRCPAKNSTFDVRAQNYYGVERHGWLRSFELFCVCRHCHRGTIFAAEMGVYEARDALYKSPSAIVEYPGSLNDFFKVTGFISQKDKAPVEPPEHLPNNIDAAFREAATCMAVGAHNGAGTMFRLCIDLATKPLLPIEEDPARPNAKTCRDLGLRLPWLFENGRLPQELHDLAQAVRDDGNDGAHVGSLKQEDAEDLMDFTTALLQRLFTEPRRLEMAAERRAERRKPAEA